ncbi:hypothetical protein D3C73_491980 [compost metagenome]
MSTAAQARAASRQARSAATAKASKVPGLEPEHRAASVPSRVWARRRRPEQYLPRQSASRTIEPAEPSGLLTLWTVCIALRNVGFIDPLIGTTESGRVSAKNRVEWPGRKLPFREEAATLHIKREKGGQSRPSLPVQFAGAGAVVPARGVRFPSGVSKYLKKSESGERTIVVLLSPRAET